MIFQIYAYFMDLWKEAYHICKNMKWSSILQKIYTHPVAYKIRFLSNQRELYAWHQDNIKAQNHKIFKLGLYISIGFKEMLYVLPQTIYLMKL